MITRKTLLNELPSYGIAGNAAYALDVAKSKVGLADASVVQLRAMVSDLARGVGGAPNRFFTWFSKNIGMNVSSIRKYFGSIWSSVGSSKNIFMRVLHQIGSAIGSAISYAVKLLAPLVSQAKAFMGTSVRGLYGVTNGHLIVGVVIFACILFIIYKIYKRVKNRKAKKQAQSQAQQTPQEVVKESKEMLRDTMNAITEGINTFECCDKLTEGLGHAASVKTVAKIVKMAGTASYNLYKGWLSKNPDKKIGEGFNIFEGDYYDRGSSNPTILQNKVFISIALLCVAFVLGFFAFTNLATGISAVLNAQSVGWFSRVFSSPSYAGIFDIQKVVLDPKVIGLATGAGVAYKASKQIGPVREYR